MSNGERWCWIGLGALFALALIIMISDPGQREDLYREYFESSAASARREQIEAERPYRPTAVRPLPAQSRKFSRSLYLENLPEGRWAVVSRRAIWKVGGWQRQPEWRVFLRARMDRKSVEGVSNGGKLSRDPDWNVVVEHTAASQWTVWLGPGEVSYLNPPSDRPPLASEDDWALATAVSATSLPTPVDGK